MVGVMPPLPDYISGPIRARCSAPSYTLARGPIFGAHFRLRDAIQNSVVANYHPAGLGSATEKTSCHVFLIYRASTSFSCDDQNHKFLTFVLKCGMVAPLLLLPFCL